MCPPCSCCPKGYEILHHTRQDLDHHVSCYNSTSNDVQIMLGEYCPAGAWENIYLDHGGYELAKKNGKAVIKYFGNNTKLRQHNSPSQKIT